MTTEDPEYQEGPHMEGDEYEQAQFLKRENRLRNTIIVLVSLLILSVFYIFYLQLRLYANKNTNEVAQVSGNITGAELGAACDTLKQRHKELEQLYGMLAAQTLSPPGLFFEIQLGSFENFDLDKYHNELFFIRQQKVDTRNKLLLGRFQNPKDALLFENDMKKIGLRDVFIAGRHNGILMSFKDAMDVYRQLGKE